MSSGQKTRKAQTSRKKKNQRNKIILIVVELIVLAILAVVLYGISKLDKIERPNIQMEEIEVNEDIESEVVEVMEKYRTIAVFGLDNRNSGKFTTGNSDVMILVSINNETQEVKMCSVYRDTFLDVGGGVFKKANAAFSKDGPQAALAMLNKNLDLQISDYVIVDFNAVINCIDLMGGIEMTITDEEALWMKGYIICLNEENDRDSEVLEEGGTYHLDGVQALAYSRVRYTAGDDYKRSERQRDVIKKMAETAQKSDLKTINAIIDEVFGQISTSFSNADLISLAAQIFNYNITGSAGFPFSKNTVDVSGAGNVVAPCTLETNVVQLHKFLYNNDNYVPSSTVKTNSKHIENVTGFDETEGY